MSAEADLVGPLSEPDVATPPILTESTSLWSNTEDDDCCRVCHGEAEESRPLFHPCRCSGSIKFVHQDCLQTWLRVSNKTHPKCELCNESFQFRNIYKTGIEGGPPKLSLIEFIQALCGRATLNIEYFCGRVTIALLWFICLPLFSYVFLHLLEMMAFNDVGIFIEEENRWKFTHAWYVHI